MRSMIEEIVHKIGNGEALDCPEQRELARKTLMLFAQKHYEISGSMFITGYGGDFDSRNLPDYLLICPTYGADPSCTGMYKRVD